MGGTIEVEKSLTRALGSTYSSPKIAGRREGAKEVVVVAVAVGFHMVVLVKFILSILENFVG